MVFPQTPRALAFELYLNGTWTAITSDVYQRDGIKITRGKTDESGRTPPTACNFTVNNRFGKYSPRNPLGTYYGQIGRNTPMRARLNDLEPPIFDASSSPTAGTGNLSWTHTPTTPNDNPTGVLIWVVHSGTTTSQVTSVTYGGVTIPLHGTGDAASSPTGGTYTRHFLGSGLPRGPQTVVVTVSGAATKQAVCITVTSSSAVEINNTPANTTGTGANPTKSVTVTKNTLILGLLHSGQDAITSVAPGTGYVDVVEHDFGSDVMSVIKRSTTAAAGSHNVLWTATSDTYLINDVALSDTGIRCHTELSSLPAKWDVSGNDAHVPLTGSGILRRINSGTTPVTTGLHDLLLSTTRAAYWPLTDGEGTTHGANAGSQTGLFRTDHLGATGSVSFGAGDLGRYLTTALNIVRTGATEATDYLYGQCSTASAETTLTYEFVYKATTLGPMKVKAEVYNAGIYSHWIVYLRGDGSNDDIQLVLVEDVYFAATTTNLADTGILPEITDGQVHHVRLTLTQNGSATDYSVHLDGTSIISGSRASFTVGSLSNVFVTYIPNAGDSAVALGYVVVWTGSNAPSVTLTSSAALAHVGEKAGRRIERLCDLTDVPFQHVGDLDDTLAMGAQFEDAFDTQITEVEATDRGFIFEPRDALALAYRTRETLYNQTATATVDYSSNELANPFESVDDDQQIRNDVFAQRRDGSSYQATETTGPLSVQDPPNGVGRYKDEVTVNVETDDMLPPMAGWLLHLGTVDEARFPQLTFNLANPDVSADLARQLLTADVGDRLVITDSDTAGIYDEISLLVLGYTETINTYEHTLTFNCVPASPYEVLELDHADARIDCGEGSTLNEAMTTTETDMDVASSGFLWTTDAGQMPISIIVGGEEMSVTAISGASSPQTFTVTRSVNGVVKTHSTGAVVRLKRPAVLAL